MQRPAHHLFIRKNCGLTLIELLIAMLLSSLILLSAYTLLNYQQHFYEQHKQQIHFEQNKRFAQFVLSNAIHQAGFFGCRSIAHSKIQNHVTNQPLQLLAIFGYQSLGNTWLPALPKNITAKKGTDVLAIMYLNPNAILKKNDITVVSNCEQADIFSSRIIKVHTGYSETGELIYQLFYIKPKDPKDKNSADDLYLLDQNHNPEELVDNVSQLKLSFATSESPNNFLSANGITNWSQVHSVKIDLVFSRKNGEDEKYSFVTSLRNQ